MSKTLLCLCTAVLWVGSVSLFAQDFSADMVHQKPESSVLTKVKVSGAKMRFETSGAQQHSMVAILDLSTHTSTTIIPDSKTYIVSAPGKASAAMPFFVIKDPENACPDWEKAFNKPGTCSKDGEETVNGRSTVKYHGTAPNGDTGYAWVDRKLHFVTKWQGEKGASELQNIKVEAQPSYLFTVPAGYEKMDVTPPKKKAAKPARAH